MKARKLTLKNYSTFVVFLESLSPNHRYFKYLKELFYDDFADRAISDNEKSLIIEKIKDAIQKVKQMTDEEFKTKSQIEGTIPRKMAVLWHHPKYSVIERHNLLGDLRIVSKLIESPDGSTASIQTRVEEKVNGKWIDRGELT